MSPVQQDGQQSGEGPDGSPEKPGSSRRHFLKLTSAALGGAALGDVVSAGSAPVDQFTEVYASAHQRMLAAQEAAAAGVGQITEASARIAARQSSAAIESGGMEVAARTVRQHTLDAQAAKQEMLEAYMKEHGVKVQPLNRGLDPNVAKANSAVAEVKKTLRDDARALEDLKRQVQQIEEKQAQKEEAYEQTCSDLRDLLVEPAHIRVLEATLGSTPRYIVTTINHSFDSGTESHTTRKETLQRLHGAVEQRGELALDAPAAKSERWIVRRPKGALRAVLAEAAALGK